MAFVSSFAGVTGRVAASKTSSFSGSAVASTPARKATIMMGLGNQALGDLGLDKFMQTFEVKGTPMNQSNVEEYTSIINAIYQQVFANAYIMDSEKAEWAVAESQFKLGVMTVKEFIMTLAMTNQYKKRFFDNRPLYGAIEMNFKHFLGRTPDGLEQYRAKSGVYDSMGYEKFVMSFFEDGEYDLAYGDWGVPSYRGYLTTANLSMASFTHFFKMVRGGSTSDKGSINALIPLNKLGITSTPLPVKLPGGPVFIEGLVKSGASGNSINSAAPTVHGARVGERMFRIEVSSLSQGGPRFAAGISTGPLYTRPNGYSKYARSNKAILCSADDLSKKYQEITKNGGRICAITPV